MLKEKNRKIVSLNPPITMANHDTNFSQGVHLFFRAPPTQHFAQFLSVFNCHYITDTFGKSAMARMVQKVFKRVSIII